MIKILKILILTIFFFCFLSCSRDVNEIVKINRFDSALISMDTLHILNDVKKLYAAYPDFFPFYIAEVMEENPADTIRVAGEIKKFLSDTVFQKVNGDAAIRFANTEKYEKVLGKAFRNLKIEFPEIELPEIYFFVSGFNRALITCNNLTGVGVDLFLGADYPAYKDFSYSYFKTEMIPEAVPVVVLSQLLYELAPAMNRDRLLEQMIFHGKIMFILSELLPDYKPENIIAYSTEQIEWCEKFEREIWTAIVEQKHLFSSDLILINKYVNDAPFTTPVSQESPGRLGVWVGWQIVKSYMKNNRNIPLKTLLNTVDASALLEKSGYKP